VTYDSGGGTGTRADIDRAVALAQKSDVVIVMAGDNPHELCDRETLRLPIIPPADPNFCGWDEIAPGEIEPEDGQVPPDFTRNSAGEIELPSPPRGRGTDQEALMQALVAAPGVAAKMVVVLKTEGMVLMPWLEAVPALIEAWYPGQEDGNAVARILFGLRNPSGKLPMTFGNTSAEAAHATTAQFPGVFIAPPNWLNRPRVEAQYTEGLQVGYRWYEANAVTPVFPFGFGLSYTTFAYSGLSVTPATNAQGQPVLTVTYAITNTGSREGAEASQVYLTLPPEAGQPSKRLVGFQKVDLSAGESRQVTVTIDSSASNHPFSYWVPENDAPAPGWSRGDWQTASGNYTVHVGTSSADTPLEAMAAVTGGGAVPPTNQPGTCSTALPGDGWVCVNGGWLPPGHPGIPTTPGPSPGPTPPAGCATASPGDGWVCVNGGWLPPGHPGAAGVPVPAPGPTPNPPTSCMTVQPVADWVCVNGGWLPPDHPLANRGGTGGH
jgi:beta-glucosidase